MAAGAVSLLLLVGLALYLATPRTTGVDGDWSAKAADGKVVADRALVSGDNTALDLRTGKSVTLGSVRGGTPYVADERLIIATTGRIDSVRLDASIRWTWRAPTGTTAMPLAAAGGSTLVLVCPVSGPCQLVGLNARGRQDWQTDDVARRNTTQSDGSLPQVDAAAVPGGGVVLTDPSSGRSTLQPARSFLATANGPVVTELLQGGRCVVAAYTSAGALWTRVLDTCPGTAQPTLSSDARTATLTWPTRVERLDLATGKTVPVSKVGHGTTPSGRLIAQASGLVATLSQRTLRTNPFRWGAHVTVVTLRDSATADVRAQLVSDESLALLHLDGGSVVVREGDRVIRYSLDAQD